MVLRDQRKSFADRGQNSQSEAIHLQNPQGIEVVLVPLDYRPVVHSRIFDGHQLTERALAHDHSADMLAQVPRKSDQLPDQVNEPPAERLCTMKPS